MAIGWHFFHEGIEKIRSGEAKPGQPFSAEEYLRASTGPLAGQFRGLIPDADSLGRLDLESLKAAWAEELSRLAAHYGLNAEQRTQAESVLAETSAKAERWFADPDTIQKLRDYRGEVAAIQRRELGGPEIQYEEERLIKDRRQLETTRKELVAPIAGWEQSLRESWGKLATPDQLAARDEYRPEPSPIDRVNLLTMWGLTIVGLCLIFGLLTPMAALLAAGYLLMFYLSMPPWPGLPESPRSEGHYLYVNKNLIEMVACLVLASTPNGLWFGLDAFLFGWIGRGRRDRDRDRAAAVDPPLAVPTEVVKP